MRVAIFGASGRMGTALVRLIAADDRYRLTGALAEPGDPAVGQDAGLVARVDALGIAVTANLGSALGDCDVVIDFTAPAATRRHAEACAAAARPLVVGTTGLDPAGQEALAVAARRIPVLYARNMSLGVTVLTELARQAALLLGEDFDVEIIESHHRHKKDAPSGTALQLGEAVAAARGGTLAGRAVTDRDGPRPAGAIGFASVRGGSIVGEHTVLLAGHEEVLELTHRATDRALFARGALRAANWLGGGRAPGLYDMRDVLGIGA